MHAKPRSGKSKGKIEKFHQVVDDFIRESKLKNIRTLEELNRLWAVYLEEYYHKQRHAGIAEYYESLGSAVPEEGISPLQEWTAVRWPFWMQRRYRKLFSIMSRGKSTGEPASASVENGMKRNLP